jgi:twitching motility protein PilJ
MSVNQRWIMIGALIGLVGGAVSLSLRMVPGPVSGVLAALLPGALVGGFTAALVAGRILHQAAVHLGSLTIDDSPDELTALGHGGFDAAVAMLHEVLDRSRELQLELERSEQSARSFWASIDVTANSQSSGISKPSGAGLPAVLDQMRQTAMALHRDASSLEELNERVASGAADQSEAVTRTASAVEALSERIDRISTNADEAARACKRARDEAHRGLEQVHTAIEGMDRLLARNESNGRMTMRLDDRSSEIGNIVNLIREISSRTDMLALNATIESVRAGEHGRGFAVVAEEIRKLAEKTATATREIGTIVEAIQVDSHESIRALGEEQAEMQRESERIRETGSALDRISQVAEHSAKLVEGISSSTNDQVLAAQDLVRAMQRISEVTQQTLERTTKSRSSLKSLVQSCEPWQRLASAAAGPTESVAIRPASLPVPHQTPSRRRELAGSETAR